MENFETIETFDEIDTDINYDSENFPTKDRGRSAARRKKTYFKGKKRFARFANDWGLGFIVGNRRALQGFMRKTNAKNPFKDVDNRLNAKRANVRRQDMASTTLADYMED